MIVEERCYTLKPGTVQVYYRDYDPRGLEIQKRILGNLIGYFHTEIGELNQIVHLWGYDSLAERERRRALLAADPAWLTSDVVALARGIYDERTFDRMPILADALQDAGCDSADILNHCRGAGPHVRGCWVVDLVLGKA